MLHVFVALSLSVTIFVIVISSWLVDSCHYKISLVTILIQKCILSDINTATVALLGYGFHGIFS